MTLLEARGRLGGAAYSFERGELAVDNGQHVFLRCCTAYRELLEQLGADELVTLQPRLEVPVLAPGGRRARLRALGAARAAASGRRAAALPVPRHARALSAAWAMQRAAIGRSGRSRATTRARSATGCAEHGQDARAIEAIWELIARPTLNLAVADASLAQAAQVFQVGLLGEPPPATSAGRSHRCRRSTTWPRGGRSAAPASSVRLRSTVPRAIAPDGRWFPRQTAAAPRRSQS